MTNKERVRFAPSPTGHLHIGNARTALLNYLFAAHYRGTLVLRIEDTDLERSAGEYANSLTEALRWLGIKWDEGPDCGGPKGSYVQSERLGLYRRYARTLLQEGKAFSCYCLDEELEAHRKKLLREGRAPRYSGKCRGLSSGERKTFEEMGRVPCIRYRVPDRGTIQFEDVIHGSMAFRAEEIGDFVLVRSTGMASYNFAVVIDDHLMEITTVIRGEDHLANTPRQLLLYRQFGWQVPRFAHHALLVGQDRAKLSKRHGVASIEALRELGMLPEAIVNYLALLGGNPVAGKEVFTPAELIANFSLEKTARNAAVFDLKRLLWMNRQHLRRRSPEKLVQTLKPFLERAGYAISGHDQQWLENVAAVLAENVQALQDVSLYAPIFFQLLPETSASVRVQLREVAARRVLETFLARFARDPTNDPDSFAAIVRDVGKQCKVDGRDLYLPLRLALTGLNDGPELDRIVSLLDPQTILKRLQAALTESAS